MQGDTLAVLLGGRMAEAVVADYESLQETAYLLRSPANAQRLLESIRELEERRGVVREVGEAGESDA